MQIFRRRVKHIGPRHVIADKGSVRELKQSGGYPAGRKALLNLGALGRRSLHAPSTRHRPGPRERRGRGAPQLVKLCCSAPAVTEWWARRDFWAGAARTRVARA